MNILTTRVVISFQKKIPFLQATSDDLHFVLSSNIKLVLLLIKLVISLALVIWGKICRIQANELFKLILFLYLFERLYGLLLVLYVVVRSWFGDKLRLFFMHFAAKLRDN